jgi:hypothetical protein
MVLLPKVTTALVELHPVIDVTTGGFNVKVRVETIPIVRYPPSGMGLVVLRLNVIVEFLVPMR